jgi:serine/threonine protein kinase
MTGWIGRQIAKYEVKELVGRGGMATVYKAFHPDLERDVAIKMIHRIQCHQWISGSKIGEMSVEEDAVPDKLSDSVTDEAVESLCRRLGRLDPCQIAAWRAMSPARRLELAFQAYQFALDVVRLTERQRNPDLSPDDLAWRVTRRMQGNPRLGR